jgi:hypothetical protein
VLADQARLSQELEVVGEDMERMQQILDALEKLNSQVRGRAVAQLGHQEDH